MEDEKRFSVMMRLKRQTTKKDFLSKTFLDSP